MLLGSALLTYTPEGVVVGVAVGAVTLSKSSMANNKVVLVG